MIVIKFKGGLGNQMFQYALYKCMEEQGKNVKADLNFFQSSNVRYQLEDLFNIHVVKATAKECEQYGDFSKRIIARVRRKFFGKKKSYLLENMERFYDFTTVDNLYLDGYWQNEKYFSLITKELRKDFELCGGFDNYQNHIYEHISKEIVASIHVRRGDYLSQGNVSVYGNICTDCYYEVAIDYLKSKYGVRLFYVFSDDVEWAKHQFVTSDDVEFYIVEKTDDRDMFLMSACKYNIIANSSYSWWASWLNRNEGKVVIAPSIWLNDSTFRGVYCPEWVLIDSDGKIL